MARLSKRIVSILEHEGWNHYDIHKNGNSYWVDLEKETPAGEDYLVAIYFDGTSKGFVNAVKESAKNFDPDEYAENNVFSRGHGGIPETIRALVNDADAIKDMLIDLAEELSKPSRKKKVPDTEPEFTDEQLARIDEVENAAMDFCKILCEDPDLEWDMSYVGEIADVAADILVRNGKKVRYPAHVTEKDGSEYIEDYHTL